MIGIDYLVMRNPEHLDEIKYYSYDIIVAKYDSVCLYAMIEDGVVRYRLEDLNREYENRIINNDSSLAEFFKYLTLEHQTKAY